MTPQQVHDLGLVEVARIEAEMSAILAAQSELRSGETPAAALARLAQASRASCTPTMTAGRQAALADYTAMIQDQLERSAALFGRLPKATIEVRRVPEFKEKTAPGAYYNPPAFDGSRPGIFFANLRDMSEDPRVRHAHPVRPRGCARPPFPDRASRRSCSGVPTFRKVLPFTAYLEGWALYAEWLGKEMGLYENDPFGDLGRLQAEMFRAVRLVVDTGIHHQRWTRERAIALHGREDRHVRGRRGLGDRALHRRSPARPAPTRSACCACRRRASARARRSVRASTRRR